MLERLHVTVKSILDIREQQQRTHLLQILLAGVERPLEVEQKLTLCLRLGQRCVDVRLRKLGRRVSEGNVPIGRYARIDVARLDLFSPSASDTQEKCKRGLTMFNTTARTSSAWSPTSLPMSLRPSVRYVSVSFLISHRGARSMTCCTSPTFWSVRNVSMSFCTIAARIVTVCGYALPSVLYGEFLIIRSSWLLVYFGGWIACGVVSKP